MKRVRNVESSRETSVSVRSEHPPNQKSQPPRRRTGKGRSLQSRLVLWTVGAVVVSTFTTTVAMNLIAYRTVLRQHERNTSQLTRVLADGLAGRLSSGWSEDARQVVDPVLQDPRVVFVEVSDLSGQTLYRPVADTGSLNLINDPRLTTSDLLSVHTDDGPLVLRRQTVWSQADNKSQARSAEAYLTLGLLDANAPTYLWKLTALQFAVALLVCLVVVTITGYVVARWMAPLRLMRDGVEMLAAGKRPPTIHTQATGDLGRLCEAFNAMVRELYRAHEQLADTNHRLETVVKQRTAELRQVNDKLEVEATDKNEFLRAISHDLNAPLRNISGMANMMLIKYRAELADDVVSKLERINANAKHQTELIADLLELSRLRTKDVRPEPVEIRPLIDRITDSLTYDLEKAEIQLKIEGDFPTVYAERNRIRQVFQNLIDNAIKYMMDSKTRTISVTAERTKDFEPDIFNGIDVWRFSISDTGRGIAEQDQAAVFQVFSRSTRSGTHSVAGRGVGLASVKAIVEQYGGRIWLDSQLHEGTTFTFTLPVDRVTVPPKPDLEHVEAPHAAASHS